ncbi:hypothetical protein Poli38472_014863 [Pythium oligandrum]|uniref:Uncharacterized protein n=1 Tax=Pythium oligandrum TaxID=41045 RepID=A0A8K1FCW4_PYTOL|nr:hypothetical protein Poli38472_014863 [Pythium oligandrum]|eukprot:TMW57676.1 hypothetical protein Poli38472_014863 [Pythium oligandrum]
MTRAEWTFVPGGTDYYDVTVINGVNIPVMMEPLDVKYDPKDPYKCGSPGKVEDVVPGSGCSWDYAKFQKDFHYNAVTVARARSAVLQVTVATCEPGLRLDGGNKYFKCQEPAGDQTGKNIHEFHGCVSPDYLSGYQPASKGKELHACGCTDWQDRGVKVFDTPPTEKCKAVNPKWIEKIVPTLDFLKKACPRPTRTHTMI